MTLTNKNIESILILCQKGNQLAQLEVYNRYAKAMYNTAYRIVHDSAEAEDVMQEAFITAFSKLHTFKGTATFGAWLKRIVINASIAKYKQNKRFVSLDENESLLPETKTIEQEEDFSTMKAQQVLTVLKTLKPSYQTALTLHYIEGLDYEEMCEVLTINYGNCRTLISRAKESLRKKLNNKTT